MKKKLIVALIPLFYALFISYGPAIAESTPAEVTEAAEAWLKLVDNGEYGKTFDTAAEIFKSASTKIQWEATLDLVRKNLGKTIERKPLSAQFATSLPGAPDGEYYVMEFRTVFQNKKEAVERLVPMKEKDGRWRVSGYFIR
ncbi:MAG: DUF4019 domain-containing protein [Deltaproteobacteria bacterium]|nr:DUF4019 domain-containing protein [Deltaproteobacteria bacterium]